MRAGGLLCGGGGYTNPCYMNAARFVAVLTFTPCTMFGWLSIVTSATLRQLILV